MQSLNIFLYNPAFWNLYIFDSKAILLIGFTLLPFLVVQIILLYVFIKRKSWWVLIFSNLLTGIFVWAATIYFLYAPMVLDYLFY